MINPFDGTEAHIPFFDTVNKKYYGCKHALNFTGQKTCELFNFILDTSMDVSIHCATCLMNTKQPTTSVIKVRV